MSRRVQITNAAIDIAEQAFFAGAKWADRNPTPQCKQKFYNDGFNNAVDMACQWIRENYPRAAAYYETPEAFAEQFKSGMTL